MTDCKPCLNHYSRRYLDTGAGKLVWTNRRVPEFLELYVATVATEQNEHSCGFLVSACASWTQTYIPSHEQLSLYRDPISGVHVHDARDTAVAAALLAHGADANAKNSLGCGGPLVAIFTRPPDIHPRAPRADGLALPCVHVAPHEDAAAFGCFLRQVRRRGGRRLQVER